MKTLRCNGLGKNPKLGNAVSQLCISDLTTDILLHIFFRLPIKAVMRCKCVCRVWYDLISEPKFSDDYTINSPFTQLFVSGGRMTSGSYSQFFSLLEFSENRDCIRTPIDPKVLGGTGRYDFLLIEGVSNGLLCVELYRSPTQITYIVNPITGEMIALPECKTDQKDEVFEVIYRFGHSPSTNNFKVLRNVQTMRYKRKVQIFTVGVDDKWRYLEDPLNARYLWCKEVLFNGVFHWMSKDSDCVGILTFDLGKEKVGHIPYPVGLISNCVTMNLALVNNYLCLIDLSLSSQISIWRMKEYAVVESWTKDVILGSWFPSRVHFDVIKPVAFLKSGDILFPKPGSNYFLSYNPRKNTSKEILISDAWSNACLGETFTPKFSSLKQIIIGGHRNTLV